MRNDPGLNLGRIAACLEAEYNLRVASVTFLPIGFDLDASVYEVATGDGTAYFLKARFGPVHEPGMLVPRALIDHGIRNVVAPIRTRSSALWCSCNGCSLILSPFIRGENAMVAGLTAEQWRTFGTTLRAVHDSPLSATFRDRLRTETFTLPSATLVRTLQKAVVGTTIVSPAADRFRAFWRERATRIDAVLARADELGRSLQTRAFAYVLCHADIHAANILVGDDEQIHLIDWDGPLIAPRERDLLFVVGSRIARVVEPWEEDWFFAGYGPVTIDPDALIYYRYERIVEDLGEIGKRVLLDPTPSEEARAAEAALAMSFFAPNGDIDHVETIPNRP